MWYLFVWGGSTIEAYATTENETRKEMEGEEQ